MIGADLRCPFCGQPFITKDEELIIIGMSFDCENCGERLEISFDL